ncbi:MAG: carbohydrate ABC transporter permease [Micrococcales bacterium]|nr:carbohydrate ABC transporter permease [Micrococcales bacterium]
MRRSHRTLIVKWVLLVLIGVSMLLPLAWMALCGFKPDLEVLKTPFQFLPQVWHPENYTGMLHDSEYMTAVGMTFLGTLIFTALSLTVNSMSAYVFARLEFRLKRFFWVFCILPMFVPGMSIMITSFVVVSKLHMLNTLAVLIIPGVAGATQMFFMRQFFLAMPMAVEDAARLDGCSRWKIFYRIFIPNSAAVFVVVGMMSYMAYWNAYVWPILTITGGSRLQQIMPVLANFLDSRGPEYGQLMAASTMAALPTVILLLIFQRYIVAGVRISGIK